MTLSYFYPATPGGARTCEPGSAPEGATAVIIQLLLSTSKLMGSERWAFGRWRSIIKHSFLWCAAPIGMSTSQSETRSIPSWNDRADWSRAVPINNALPFDKTRIKYAH